MWVALLIPTVLSFLLLGAHFLRYGSVTLLVVSLLIPLTLLIRHRWVARATQAVLLIAALEWVRTAWLLAEDRLAKDEPWTRMTVILGGVALWAVVSALLFETPPLRRRYRRVKTQDDGSGQDTTA
jgi:hypothetical protein